MTAPGQPGIDIVPGTRAHRLIRGVLRMDLDTLHVERVILFRAPAWTVSVVDTGDGDVQPWMPTDDTTFHILWQMDENDAWIEVDGQRYPIAPGDTLSVPAKTAIRQAAGMLLVRIEANSVTLDGVLPPSHGTETFEGFSRRTDYETPAAFTLQRWKITQPLTLSASESTYAIVDLAAPLALTWPGGTDLFGRGECRVVPPGTGPITLLPDGLGYAVTIR